MSMRKTSHQQPGVLQQMARGGLTLRKLLVLAAAAAVLKVTWNLLRGGESRDADLTHLERMSDYGFNQNCIFVNGKCKPLAGQDSAPITGKGLYAYRNQFYLDGQQFRILSGSFHYFRTLPEQWADRLFKMKAAGLNTVTTYIPWNVHEKTRLQYNFGGRNNLVEFIKQVQRAGLHLIVRAGPYICAEWDLGGLPAWLLHDPDIRLRDSTSEKYMQYVEQYFSRLLPIFQPFTHKKGGPIIAFQIENEFGSWQKLDENYLRFLLNQHKSFGLDELFLTSDGSAFLPYGTLPGVVATVNFAKSPEKHLTTLREFRPNQPLMVTEFWSGWFDHWYEKHHEYEPNETAGRVQVVLDTFNASINFYMFTGGTNFAFYNGANNDSGYAPTVTSYDYNAPISENGDVTPKYFAIRDVIQNLNLGPSDWPTVPTNQIKAHYGEVELTAMLPFTELVKISTNLVGSFSHKNPKCMEELEISEGKGQGYGWILYKTKFKTGEMLDIKGIIHDRAQVFINRKQIAVYSWTKPVNSIQLDKTMLISDGNILEILVENLGRVNYRRNDEDPRLLENQTKGLKAQIYVDNNLLSNWEHFPIDFERHFREAVSGSKSWTARDKAEIRSEGYPFTLRGNLKITDDPLDTFIDMSSWNKGIVIVNGFNLGRYWNVGPQLSLYVPAPLLHKGDNEIVVFELHYSGQRVLTFTNKQRLG